MNIAEHNALAATALAHALCAGAATHVVVAPGSRSAPLALAFDACPKARVHVALDERAAAFVALGMARASRRPAIVLCTSGSALCHFAPAVIEAHHARVPLVVVSADRPRELHGCGAPQTVEQMGLFAGQLRLAAELPTPDERLDPAWLAAVAARALAQAAGSPPGPVHLNAPFREPLWSPEVATKLAPPSPPELVRGRLALEDGAVELLAGELVRHERGVIVCGPLAPATLDAEELGAAVAMLAARCGFPVLADPASGVRYASPRPDNLVASYDALLRAPGFARAHAPTLVLHVGAAPTGKALGAWLAAHARGRLWLVDRDAAWHDPASSASKLIVADPAGLCRALAVAVAGSGRAGPSAWLESWLGADARASAIVEHHSRDGGWEGAIARAVVAALPPGAHLHVASSMPIRDVDSFALGADRPITVHANRGTNGIDGTIATALGEALASGRPSAVLLGDLALLHDLDGLENAAQSEARLTAVVINNGGGGIFSFLPIARHPTAFERLFVTPRPCDLAALCRALGARHQQVAAEPVALMRSLGAALEERGLDVIEVVTDRALNVARHESVFAAVRAAVDAPASERQEPPRGEPTPRFNEQRSSERRRIEEGA
jgi:2-succinyl-5-enolpyruvyl-6-hydroxy-3-cyclohexene-1-carboxylate synthase